MAFHTRYETKDPDEAPAKVGQHWSRTDTGENWLAHGTSAVSDWKKIGDTAKDVTTGSFSAGDQDIAHGLGTKDLSSVTIYDASDNVLDLTWKPKDTDTITVEFPPDGLNAGARVVVRL